VIQPTDLASSIQAGLSSFLAVRVSSERLHQKFTSSCNLLPHTGRSIWDCNLEPGVVLCSAICSSIGSAAITRMARTPRASVPSQLDPFAKHPRNHSNAATARGAARLPTRPCFRVARAGIRGAIGWPRLDQDVEWTVTSGRAISHVRPSARQSSRTSPPTRPRTMASITWLPKPLCVGGLAGGPPTSVQ
jgi:hypothetical protein